MLSVPVAMSQEVGPVRIVEEDARRVPRAGHVAAESK